MQYDIEDLRKSLDIIDHSLLLLLAERFWVIEKTARYKQEKGLPIADLDRRAEHFKRIEKIAKEVDIDPEFAQKLLELVIEEGHRRNSGESLTAGA